MAAAEVGLDTIAGGSGDESTLRLVWPQWQGAGTSSVRSLAAEFPFDVARRGYAVGSAVLEAVLPPHAGPTATVPVEIGDVGLEKVDGIEAKSAVVDQLGYALKIIRRHNPARIVTLGGECSVSVAPFSDLAARYVDDLAILWVDSHPDIGTPASEYPGYHAMAVAALTGHGDPELWPCSRPSWRQSGSRWSGCTPGPKMTTRTSRSGASARSAPRSSAHPASRC